MKNSQKKNELYIDGVSVLDLVKTYQTPLYVVDETKIRNQCQIFRKHFVNQDLETETINASKAFLTITMCH